nr:ribonuclease H-like domain, reverse transcriptase, RNA-dependent DNA polymerase [Tanacetum cinerariifolium]
MTDFVMTVRQDTDEIYVRLDDAQDDRLLMNTTSRGTDSAKDTTDTDGSIKDPLEILSPLLPISPPPLPASPTYSLGYRAAMIRLRAEALSTSHLLPLSTPPSRTPPLLPIPLPTSSPPFLLPFMSLRFKVDKSSSAPTARPTEGFIADYRFVGTLDDKIRRDPKIEVGLSQRMTDFVMTVRQDTDEIYKMTPKITTRSTPATTTTTTTTPVTNAQLKELIDQGIADALVACDTDRSRNDKDNHDSRTSVRRQAPPARECTYQDFMKCKPIYFKDWKKIIKVINTTSNTLMEPNKTLIKDAEAEDVDVHLYRSMIGSLMYLTASRPDIMFAVCACARFQVTPKTSHLHAVKRIFRYLKCRPKLGLLYPRDSPFNLEAFSDSDYAGAGLDRKFTTGGCQFLGSTSGTPRFTLKIKAIAKSKTVNDVKQIHAKVDGKTTIISESSIRSNLYFNDEDVVEGECSRKPSEPQPPSSTSPQEQVLAAVGDEAVYTREDDRVVRAATTTASLEAEQKSGDTDAQTRFETASKQSYDPPLSEVNTSGSREDNMEHQDYLTDFIPPTPYDSPLSGGHTPGSDEGRPNINELMNICNKLLNRVLALEQFKNAQDLVIKRLKKKVKRLEKKQRARNPGRKLFKIDTSKKKNLDKENVSKQGRDESNITEELNLSDKGSSETGVFDYFTAAEKDVNAVEPVSSVGDAVNAASVIPDVSVAGPSTSIAGLSTSIIEDIFKDEMTTMADTLMAIRRTKPRTTSVVIHDVEEEPKRATPLPIVQSQDKGKGKMVEPEPISKNPIKAHIQRDAKIAQRLFEEEQAQFEEQKWINDFVSMVFEEVNDSNQQAESSKKRSRADHDKESVKKQKLEEDNAKTEELRACLDIVPVDDIAINVDSLATKYPIVDWKIHTLIEYMIIAIYMVVERKYPLIQEMLSRMLNKRLEIDHEKSAITWWNSYVKTVGPDVAYAMTWTNLKKKMTEKYYPRGVIKKLEVELCNLKVKESDKIKRYITGLPDMLHGSVMV